MSCVNPFIPKFLKWTSIFEFGHVHRLKQGFQCKIKNRMANSEDPVKMTHYELSYLDLRCLRKYLFWSTGLKGLIH